MSNSTETYWDVNGVSLQTYAWNMTTWGGDSQAPPPLRGEDLTIPYRPGSVFQARRPAGRSMTFSMWVQGSDQDGKVPTSRTQRALFEENYRRLRGLFWNQGQQFTLTKRWEDPLTGVSRIASAKAVFVGGLAPFMQGHLHATFTVEVFLSDPFFYGNNVTVDFTSGTTSNRTVTILGDYETTRIVIEFDGARNNPRMTNTSEGIYVNLQQNLSTGQLGRLDVEAWTARKGSTNVIGTVTNFGHEFWFAVKPGSQSLSLTSTSGSGTGSLRYTPRWL